MSSSIFFHNFGEVNLKLWALACLSTALLATCSAIKSQPDAGKLLGALLNKGQQAENSGLYRQARYDFDIALLQARAGSDKAVLIKALIDSARIDNEFEEDRLAIALAREAVDLSTKTYGAVSERTAEAMCALADVLADNNQSLSLYKKAIAILRSKSESGGDFRFAELENGETGNLNARIARILTQMSFCYADMNSPGSAISAARAALKIYETNKDDSSADYARALAQYACVMNLDRAEKKQLLKTALTVQENALGKNHPELSWTLSNLAPAQSDTNERKSSLRRALQIDESVFGASSLRVARDLTALADESYAAGQEKAARELLNRAAVIYRKRNPVAETMSTEFLDSYSRLLHGLRFEKDATRIDTLLLEKHKQLSARTQHRHISGDKSTGGAADNQQDARLITIGGLKSLRSEGLDHIQIWCAKGNLRLVMFCAGEVIWHGDLGKCPSGVVNARIEKNTLTVSRREGSGPLWHNDIYRLEKAQARLISSSGSDAFAQQIEQQLNEVLNGNDDFLAGGAIEKVPSKYITRKYLAEAIKKGEHKALQLYMQGDPGAAAERLAMIFELTERAVAAKHKQLKHFRSDAASWVSAWQNQGLPVIDYITALNDYGFFLQQNDCLKESQEVLELVTKIAPGRAVARLNLGDSYWKLAESRNAQPDYSESMRRKAQSCYNAYLNLLDDSGKANVPTRVHKRLLARSADS